MENLLKKLDMSEFSRLEQATIVVALEALAGKIDRVDTGLLEAMWIRNATIMLEDEE